jgi:hypothetical protein
VEVGRRGELHRGVLLGGDAEDVALVQPADQRDGSLAADGEGDDGAGEEDPVAERQERER